MESPTLLGNTALFTGGKKPSSLVDDLRGVFTFLGDNIMMTGIEEVGGIRNNVYV